MSLQICPNCKKQNSYWKIYKELNKKHLKNWMQIECDFCKSKMVLNYWKKSIINKIIYWIFWLILPILIIFLTINWTINYISAIIIVTIFHFIAMYAIIKLKDYNL